MTKGQIAAMTARFAGIYREVMGHHFGEMQAYAAPLNKIGTIGTIMYIMTKPMRDDDGEIVMDGDGQPLRVAAGDPVEVKGVQMVEDGPNGSYYRIKASAG